MFIEDESSGLRKDVQPVWYRYNFCKDASSLLEHAAPRLVQVAFAMPLCLSVPKNKESSQDKFDLVLFGILFLNVICLLTE